MEQSYGKTWIKRNGSTYNTGISIETGHRRMTLGQAAKRQNPAVKRFNELGARITAELIKVHFPEMAKGVRERQWHANAALSIGHEDNIFTTTPQLNLTKPEKSSPDSLHQVGTVHIDMDNPILLTATFFLRYYPKGWFPRRFLVTDARLTCIGSPESVLLMPGTHPHFGLGAGPQTVPETSPLYWKPPVGYQYPKSPTHYKHPRGVIVSYPKNLLTHPNSNKINENLKSEETALVFFGTMRNFQEWRMKCAIRDDIELFRSIVDTDAECKEHVLDRFCSIFRWVDPETGQEEYPRRPIAEIRLTWAGKKDEEYEALKKTIDSYGCGKKFPSNVEGRIFKNERCGKVEWTHQNVQIPFDLALNTVP